MKIVIIGAGPTGCYVGYLLAKAGNKVEIYENHSKIGEPIQCTGLLTEEFDYFNLPKKEFLINTFSQIEINSPSLKHIIKQKEYLVCRSKFDNYLAKLAKDAGAKIFLNHSFSHKEGKKIVINDSKNNKKKEITPDLIIAADGPLSLTTKAFGFYEKSRKNYLGMQAIVKGRFNPDQYQTFFGRYIFPDLFAWIVPESEHSARVGLASMKNTKKYFDLFMKNNKFKATKIRAGIIPLYSQHQKLKKNNCYVLGDAAGCVKSTTLGGIVPGMKQAEILANCIINNKNYERSLKRLKNNLWLHFTIRKILNKFSDQDWDEFISLIKQKRINLILEQHTRDRPFPLIIKTIIKEPRFLYFLKYLL